jgi:metal-responsive CopG/Arc/MetJ family transcriptional regulator
MSTSENGGQKRRGRPRTGQFPVISLRIDPAVQEEIDCWRSGEPDKPSRSRAIRRLIVYGLSAADEEIKDDIDGWRQSDPGKPSRSEAIRCLLGIALWAAEQERK